MKKAIMVICGVIVVLVLVFLVGGFFLPSKMDLRTEATLDASPQTVFEHLSTVDGLRAWWTTAAEQMPDAPAMEVKQMGEQASGKGMTVGFSSGGEVFETWEVTSAEPPHRIQYEIDFQVMVVNRTITLEPADTGDATHVVWEESAEIDNPFFRWMGVLGTSSAVENFDQALDALGQVATQK